MGLLIKSILSMMIESDLRYKPEEAAKLYKLIRIAKKQIKKLEAKLLNETEKGRAPGLEIKEVRGSRYVEDMGGFYSAVEEYISPDEFAMFSNIKVQEFEKFYIDRLIARGVCDTKVQAKYFFDTLVSPFLAQRDAVKRIASTVEVA